MGEGLPSTSGSTPSSEFQVIQARGLAHLAAFIFGFGGVVITIRALYDLFWGAPEANIYSARPWQFVTLNQWTRYAGFELCYGLSCLALAWVIIRYSRFLPKTIRRLRQKPAISLWS